MPFLTDQSYCNFMADIGKLGSDILKNKKKLPEDLVIHNLKRLQNFAWWTYEFGIMVNQNDNSNNNLDYQIYGAGILSSYDEILNIINCSKGICDRSIFIPYDINEIVLTKFDYSEIQNRYFVINSMDQLYDSFKCNQELFFYEG
jgi:phenylalanine-4-hydroxylase